MISVNIKRNCGVILELTMTGHAEYEEYGKDIVCAGVSSALTTTVNAMISFDVDAISYKEGKSFYLKNEKKDYITNTLLDNLVNILREVEANYSENIMIKEENYE